MVISVFFYISSFLSIFFIVKGLVDLYKAYPMMDTFETKGVLKDARVTKDNVLGEEFASPNTYVYFTYDVNGIEHGSTVVSTLNDSVKRNKVKSLCSNFEKNGEFESTVYVNKKDSRKAFLISKEEVSINRLYIGLLFIISAFILSIIN